MNLYKKNITMEQNVKYGDLLNTDIDNNFLDLDENYDIDNKCINNNNIFIFFKTMTYFIYSKDKKTKIINDILKFEDMINIYNNNKSIIHKKYDTNFELSEKAINFINKLYDIDFKNFNYEKIKI
jgi:hypothetical protein